MRHKFDIELLNVSNSHKKLISALLRDIVALDMMCMFQSVWRLYAYRHFTGRRK